MFQSACPLIFQPTSTTNYVNKSPEMCCPVKTSEDFNPSKHLTAIPQKEPPGLYLSLSRERAVSSIACTRPQKEPVGNPLKSQSCKRW